MVIPCSRSARRPSVSRARLVYSSPRSRLVRSTAASWSSKIALGAYSNRPHSGLVPLGDPGRRVLVDHRRDVSRRGRPRAGAGHVADRPVPDPGLEDGLLLAPGHELVIGDQDAVPLEDPALVGEVD